MADGFFACNFLKTKAYIHSFYILKCRVFFLLHARLQISRKKSVDSESIAELMCTLAEFRNSELESILM